TMKALSLIIKREYLARIQKRSFIMMTLLMPVLVIGFIFISAFLADIKDSDVKKIVVIDTTGKYASQLQSSEYYTFESLENEPEDIKTKVGTDIFGILQITEDLTVNPKAATFLSGKQAPMDLMNYINSTFSEVVKEDKLNNLAITDNVDPAVFSNIQQILKNTDRIFVSTLRMDKDGSEKETSSEVATALGIVFTMLMYTFILMYGAMVMNGVVEEKSNRIVEVMISSVRPFDLMMGKIIGIGLTGLTQLFIWIAIVAVALGLKDKLFPGTDLSGISLILANLSMLSSVNWIEILAYFIILFIGGYMIYASLFAMFGASVDSAQDTQQFVMPITLIFVFALYAGMYSVHNPDGPLAFWCSMIPLTSPIVMMVRIPFEIPLWEKLLSLVILYATIFFVVKFAAKIYRVGILMYGKKPSIKEIIKWISYK
ncbi:ABC transporter permease, partial [Dysgonomonas sp. OttesenSCG-928-M03]|nr:ABC transporter permease [Dysgonomonas sp. OttesenSCG-928-M03]